MEQRSALSAAADIALGAVVVVLTVGRIGRRHLSRPGVLIDDATAWPASCAALTSPASLPCRGSARQVQAPASPG